MTDGWPYSCVLYYAYLRAGRFQLLHTPEALGLIPDRETTNMKIRGQGVLVPSFPHSPGSRKLGRKAHVCGAGQMLCLLVELYAQLLAFQDRSRQFRPKLKSIYILDWPQTYDPRIQEKD